jgi:hypothetical protein
MVGTTATTQTNVTRHWSEGWKELERLGQLVETEGACALPGCMLKADFLLPRLAKAHAIGVLDKFRYERAVNVLTRGADLFVDQEYLKSHLPSRVFRSNYPTAYENKGAFNRSAWLQPLTAEAWNAWLSMWKRTILPLHK